MIYHVLYMLVIAIVVLLLPDEAFTSKTQEVLLVLGLLGIWRYTWGIIHLLRSLWYRKIAFPRIRRTAKAKADEAGYGHAFMLITSFRIDAPTTLKVYRGAFEAAMRAPAGATVIASIVELGDQRLIEQLYRSMFGDEQPFKLDFVRIAGTGKRDALTYGFEAISRYNPGPNDTASVIDGDSIVPADLVEKCANIFLINPRVGALTTDETCTVEGRDIFRKWYSLRFAQRQILMSSNGLAKRVLTLTGRMSMFRAQLVCRPEFYRHINEDFIEHWRLGRIKMLTGDDKSSWYWLLKNGYLMYYVPDVVVETIEQPPVDDFIVSAKVLMTRWFGNMLRTNTRALALGPHKVGLFTWWSVLDQRISMWTCLSGLTMAVLASIFVTPFAFILYLLWVAISRYLVMLTFLTVRKEVSITYPFLLYFNQIFGSFIKVYIFFRMDKQRWTRQNTTLGGSESRFRHYYKIVSSNLVHASALLVYVAVLAYTINIFSTSDAIHGLYR
ncbi:glycosyltransferase family 2 protein [Stappia sp. BW2]|uniref:glycosyltransferase n=1 Tax=Stappia sp. BW2 TaxID=2592622 RepID=UPI0011DEB1FE|nr:glycosyltransferase [Stappia sp. BW2]TYC64035.1 glycosyltransferase family 2 protein [Stappia sp. BW2]